MAAHAKTICVDDSCARADDGNQRGIVQRTHNDVDSHEPEPQRDYPESISCDESISSHDFSLFLRGGIPPKGSVLITWQTQPRTELLPEGKLILLDRSFLIGDAVKRDSTDHMSGMVVTCSTFCTLIPPQVLLEPGLFGSTSQKILKHVPAKELKNVHKFREGGLVVYNEWLGSIEECEDIVTIRLGNNSVVAIDVPDDLICHGGITGERLSVGDNVTAKKGTLRRGRWIFGAYDPNVDTSGAVVETSSNSLTVSWLCKRIGARGPSLLPSASPTTGEPPEELGPDEIEDMVTYDCQCPQISGPQQLDGYQHYDLHLGDRVRFKDLAGAAVKYDGTRVTPDGQPQGKLERIEPRSMRSQGFDTNVFLVSDTSTYVKVLWQDNTTTEEPSINLLPDSNFDLENEVWPGEVICTTKARENTNAPENDWGWRPDQVGVVQSVQPMDRIASVKWFAQADVRFLDNDTMPGFVLRGLSDRAEDVSLYDIKTSNGLSRCRGDIVMIHPDVLPEEESGKAGIEWLGEVVDIGLDGKFTVRLGLALPPREVTLGVQDVTLAYSPEMGYHDHQSLSNDSYSGSDGTRDEEMEETFSGGEYFEMWYENEDGTRATADDTGDNWSTEDEDELVDEQGDVAMNGTEPTPRPDTDTTNIQSPTETSRSEPIEPSDATTPSVSLELSSRTNAPASFDILPDSPPSDHHYLTKSSTAVPPAWMRRVQKEHKILRSSLPEGIFVRTWESRLDLFRVLIVGPVDTPYEYAPFIVDFHLTSSFPHESPEAFFHSWTNGSGPVNPNLYEDGKICLSLLGTWHGDEKHENWSPTRSTFLQILVSLLGLVLVKEPYYNEAGYEVRAGTSDTNIASKRYSERAYFRSRGFITHALTRSIGGVDDIIHWLYRDTETGSPGLLKDAIEACKKTIVESETTGSNREVDGLRRISAGAVIQLKRQLESMEKLMTS